MLTEWGFWNILVKILITVFQFYIDFDVCVCIERGWFNHKVEELRFVEHVFYASEKRTG